MPNPLLSVRGLRIESRLGGQPRTLVDDIDLDIQEGEIVGFVGESGSGKSLTARALLALPPPGIEVFGEIRYRGQSLIGASERALRRIRGSEISCVLQDPFTALNPLRRCGLHIEEMLHEDQGRRAARHVRRAEVVGRLAEVGIDDPQVADRLPFELSGGMRQRVAIAAALAGNPNLLIADEPTTALDTVVQREILDLMRMLRDRRSMAILLITHDLNVAFTMCDKIYVLYAGRILEAAPSKQLEEEPLHPYSLGLLLSDPPLDFRADRLVGIPGSVPAADDVGASCPFAPRCEWATSSCRASAPPLLAVGEERWSACMRLPEIRAEMTERRTTTTRTRLDANTESLSNPLLQVEALMKTFQRGRLTTAALKGVDFEVCEGESVGLVGASGSGKTTLARCLVGLESPTNGSIRVADIDASDYDRLDRGSLRRLRNTIQYVFQDPYSSLNPAHTIGATLVEALAGRDREDGDPKREAQRLLAQVGLPHGYLARKPAALSGGERQRIAIARALAVGPRLVVCDEPVSALDVSVQAQILELLRELRRQLGLSYIFITHDLAVVRQVVDRVYVLSRGEVVECGPVDRVFERPGTAYTRALLAAVPRGSTARGAAGLGGREEVVGTA